MSNLNLSVGHTVYPTGEIKRYPYGFIPKREPFTPETEKRLNIWYRWLKIMKAKYNWIDNQPKF